MILQEFSCTTVNTFVIAPLTLDYVNAKQKFTISFPEFFKDLVFDVQNIYIQ